MRWLDGRPVRRAGEERYADYHGDQQIEACKYTESTRPWMQVRGEVQKLADQQGKREDTQ